MTRALLTGAVLGLLAACTVGPRHVVPEVPLPATFDQSTREATEQSVVPKVWSGFGSAELDALIVRALEANTTIAQAAARLAETRALSGLSIYSWFPTITVEGEQRKSQFSGQDPFSDPGDFETWRAGFDASWEIDLFGTLRNEQHAIDRRTEADAAALADARLSIIAETAQAWFSLIGARERLALQRRQLANLEENVAIMQARVDAGSSNALDLQRAITQARSLAASVPDSEAEVVRQEQRLAVLTAWTVGELRAQLSEQATIPELPALVATGTPEEWMKRRPDIREAERRLAAATSDVGDEIAEYFPKLNLVGEFGWTSDTRKALGRAGDGALVLWTLADLELPRLRPRAPVREGGRSATRRRDRRVPGNRSCAHSRKPRTRWRDSARQTSPRTNCARPRLLRPRPQSSRECATTSAPTTT